jgi:hypothetical protein
VYSAVVVPHEPTEAFQESVEAMRALCARLRGAVENVDRIRWHGVDLVRQRTRDPGAQDRPLPQHRLDFIYQEALHAIAGMPHVRIASVWADVGAVLKTGGERQGASGDQRRRRLRLKQGMGRRWLHYGISLTCLTRS